MLTFSVNIYTDNKWSFYTGYVPYSDKSQAGCMLTDANGLVTEKSNYDVAKIEKS